MGIQTYSNTEIANGNIQEFGKEPELMLEGYEKKINKNATDGYAGLTSKKIDFISTEGNVKSFLVNENSSPKTYLFKQRSSSIADDIDLKGKQNSLPAEPTGLKFLRGDLSWQTVSGGGSGDMLKSVYDPEEILGDAFNRLLHYGNISENVVTNLVTHLAEKIAASTVAAPSVVDGTVPRYEGTTGKIIKRSGIKFDDTSSIVLPATLAGSTTGTIYKGTDRFFHTYFGSGTYGNNLFIGLGAGNFTMGGTGYDGTHNIGIGLAALNSTTTGNYNVGMGVNAGANLTTGLYNFALGGASLQTCTVGNNNIALGVGALYSLTTGSSNTCIGFESNVNGTTGSNNICIGDSTNPSAFNKSNEMNIGNTFYGKGLGGTGKFGIGITSDNITARLHLPAGTATAGTAPLKLETGTLTTVEEPGAVEMVTDKLHFTITTGAAGTKRKEIVLSDATFVSTRVPFVADNQRLKDIVDFEINEANGELTIPDGGLIMKIFPAVNTPNPPNDGYYKLFFNDNKELKMLNSGGTQVLIASFP